MSNDMNLDQESGGETGAGLNRRTFVRVTAAGAAGAAFVAPTVLSMKVAAAASVQPPPGGGNIVGNPNFLTGP